MEFGMRYHGVLLKTGERFKSQIQSPRLIRAISFAGIVGPVILISTDVLASVLSPSYNLVSQLASDLAHGPLAWLHALGLYTVSITLAFLVFDLFKTLRLRRRGFRWGMALMALVSLNFIFVTLFPSSGQDGLVTASGILHDVAGHTIAIAFPLGCLALLPTLRALKNRLFFVATLLIGLVGAVLAIAVLFRPPWMGLTERLMLWNGAIWMVFAFILVRSELRQHANSSEDYSTS